jgi:hypothetical protein
MGLQSGEFGPKNVFRGKVKGEAFFEFQTLAELVAALKAPSASVVIVVDGNVALRGAPDSVRTTEAYVGYLKAQIDRMYKAADHIVMVFDEPEFLSDAKAVEQARRDAGRKTSQQIVCSADTLKLPTTDAFLLREVETHAGVRDLINTRQTRNRVFDEVAMRVFEIYKKQFKQALTDVRTFTLDGIDRRGGQRPIDEPREVVVASTRTRIVQALERETPIGEGDLKLTAVVDSILADRSTDGSLFADSKTFILQTIDTDSLVIEMAAQARRNCAGVDDYGVFLALRERAKRGREGEEGESSYYSVFDVKVMTNLMIKELFTLADDKPPDVVPLILQRKSIALLTLAAVMCGCDFSGFKGLRFNELIQTVQSICTDNPMILACMHAAWGDSDEELLRVAVAVKELLDASATRLASVPRRKTHCASLTNPNELEVLRSLWTLGYWLGTERRNTPFWGFPTVLPALEKEVLPFGH